MLIMVFRTGLKYLSYLHCDGLGDDSEINPRTLCGRIWSPELAARVSVVTRSPFFGMIVTPSPSNKAVIYISPSEASFFREGWGGAAKGGAT